MSQVIEVRRSVAAVSRNRRLLRAQSAYGLFSLVELAVWLAVLLWAYAAGGTSLAGLVAVLQLVPAAVLAPVGGAIGDRMPRDRALRLVYGLQALTMALTATLIARHAPQAAVVAAATAMTTVVSWARPPHYAAAAELSATAGEAAAANSLSGTLESLGFFVGPALAGVGAMLGGIAAIVYFCAALAAVAAVLVSRLDLPRPVLPAGAHRQAPGRKAPGRQARRDAEQPVRGLLHALSRRPAAAAVLVLVGADFVAEGATEIFSVAFTAERLGEGPAATGFLIGSFGVGGILGAATAVVLCGWRRLAGAVAGSLVLGGLPMLLMPHLHALLPALAVGVVSGGSLAFFAVAGITMLQRAVDDSLVARVLAVRESALLTGLAVGAAIAPLLVRLLGPGRAFAALGAGLAAVALLALPALLRLDRQAVFRPEVLALLRGVEFLAVLDTRALERLAQQAVELEVAAGSVVVRQGEPGDRYYVVEAGDLEVSVAGRSDRVALGAGDGFGEIALLGDVPRTATVRAVGACRLWHVDREAFLATIAGSAGLALAHRHATDRLDRLA